MTNGYDSFRQAMGDRRRLHLQLVLRRRARHRLPALVQVPAARAGRRSVSAGVGRRASGTGRASSRSAPSRCDLESARGLPDVVEQQAGAGVQVERPRVLLRPGLPQPDARRSASRRRSPPGRSTAPTSSTRWRTPAPSTCAARRCCRSCSQVLGATAPPGIGPARAGDARPARGMARRPRPTGATSITTASTTTRRRRRSWTPGGRGSRTRCSTPSERQRDRRTSTSRSTTATAAPTSARRSTTRSTAR